MNRYLIPDQSLHTLHTFLNTFRLILLIKALAIAHLYYVDEGENLLTRVSLVIKVLLSDNMSLPESHKSSMRLPKPHDSASTNDM